jgi:hypothetical protein
MKKLQLSRIVLTFFCLVAYLGCTARETAESPAESTSSVEMRGVYGGIPGEGEAGTTLSDFGVNAVFIGSGSVNEERVAWVKSQGAKIFAEFNTMHKSSYLEAHPDAAPVGTDGKVCPAPHDWQGICPTHPGYRAERMQSFSELVRDFSLDGVWLDYHHSHASWEREDPVMPDTCFCERCLGKFSAETGTELPNLPAAALAGFILEDHGETWVQWRCDVFTDWVREFREILDEERPGAMLGTFHNPWSDQDFAGARIRKLAIDLKAQAEYLDVFSPMPYHARFGYSDDPGWISRQTAWLGTYLGLEGKPGERIKIWPIVQLSDWGEEVAASQVAEILETGTEPPSTGVMVFAWGSLKEHIDRVEELSKFYKGLPPQ